MVVIPALPLRDLNKLTTFVRVAEHRSFTKAAQDLRTTPSVISKRLSELESSLGFSLLHRSTHGVVLTEAGEGLFRTCIDMLANIDDFVVDTRNLQTGPYGALRIKSAAGYSRWILAPLIAAFVREYPKIRVQLNVDAAAHTALDDGTDLIFASTKPAEPGFVSRELGKVDYAVCASPDYFREHGTPAEPAELRQHNCLHYLSGAAKQWPFKVKSKTKVREILVDVKGTCSSNSTAVLMRFALDGIGIVRVPRWTVKAELAGGRLKEIFQNAASSRDVMRVYFPKTKHLPAKVTVFLRFLQDALGADGSLEA
jgi:DNA-binding transcriptional LysR family regulator